MKDNVVALTSGINIFFLYFFHYFSLLFPEVSAQIISQDFSVLNAYKAEILQRLITLLYLSHDAELSVYSFPAAHILLSFIGMFFIVALDDCVLGCKSVQDNLWKS